jgi:hypothetical protein
MRGKETSKWSRIESASKGLRHSKDETICNVTGKKCRTRKYNISRWWLCRHGIFYNGSYINVWRILTNYSLRLEEVLESGRIDLGTSWRWVFSFTPRQLYSRGRAHDTYWIGGRVGPRSGLDDAEERKILPLGVRTPTPWPSSPWTVAIPRHWVFLMFSIRITLYILNSMSDSKINNNEI